MFSRLFMIRIVFVICLFCTDTFGQSLELVMNNYFIAVGGKNQVTKIKSTKETTFNWFRRNSEDTPEKGQAIKTMTISSVPYFKRFVSFDKKGNWNNEFYYNEKGSVIAMGDYIQRDSKPIKLSLCAATDLLELYVNKKLEFLRLDTIDKKVCYIIEKADSGSSEFFYFNRESHLLVAKKYSNWPDRIDFYRDYRSTNLILHPFLFETFNGGRIGYKQQTIEFEFNPEIDKKIFYFNQKEYEKRNEPKLKYESIKLELSATTLNDIIQANFKGKRVFVDMWATWCAPCKKEFRSYDSAYYSLMDSNNISLVYLSIDKDADKKKWEQDIEKLGLKGYHARASKRLVESIQSQIFDGTVITIPRYILIDEKGNILSKNFQRPSDPAFSKTINETFNSSK